MNSARPGKGTGLLAVDDALKSVLADISPLDPETVPLERALGRVLASDVKSIRDQPPFDASAMDGYAVRAEDTTQPGARLRVIGASAAGHGFRRKVGQGEAVRIFTGAPVPAGADTILIQENADLLPDGGIVARDPLERHRHVRSKGLDFAKGHVILRAGQILNARDIGLAAALNSPKLWVRRRPLVAIVSTGDELVPPGHRPRLAQIVSSNNIALSSFVTHFGGVPLDLGISRDTIAAIRARIRKAAKADVLILTGGASVGEHDLVRAALAAAGIELTFWKIAMRPGKPLMFARRGRQRIIGLPGNPVSAMVCARVFVKPLLDALLGISRGENPLRAVLTEPMKANDGRQDYVRGRLTRAPDGRLLVGPFATQDSSMMRTLQMADCLIIRGPNAERAEDGDLVDVLPLDF